MRKVFDKLIYRHQYKNLLKKVKSACKKDYSNQKSLGSMTFKEFKENLFGNKK